MRFPRRIGNGLKTRQIDKYLDEAENDFYLKQENIFWNQSTSLKLFSKEC